MTYIIANWKMMGSAALCEEMIKALSSIKTEHDIILCPPAIYLMHCARLVKNTSLKLGGQYCYWEKEGAYTGEISAKMLKEAGAEYIIIGHSERRHERGEGDPMKLSSQLTRAHENGLIPILCVGEGTFEREHCQIEPMLKEQLTCLQHFCPEKLIIAYEPLWAIGSGKIPTHAEICEAIGYLYVITQDLRKMFDIKIDFVYGGSVSPKNSASILGLKEIKGILIGKASVEKESFCSIIQQKCVF